MKTHQQSIHTSNDVKLPCSEEACGYFAPTKITLKNRVNSVHLPLRQFVLDVTKKKSFYSHSLFPHQFVCDECIYSPSHKKSFDIHSHVKHKGDSFVTGVDRKKAFKDHIRFFP